MRKRRDNKNNKKFSSTRSSTKISRYFKVKIMKISTNIWCATSDNGTKQ